MLMLQPKTWSNDAKCPFFRVFVNKIPVVLDFIIKFLKGCPKNICFAPKPYE